MNSPLFAHVVLVDTRTNAKGFTVECTCGWQATADTVVQIDELVSSHDRFVLAAAKERSGEAE